MQFLEFPSSTLISRNHGCARRHQCLEFGVDVKILFGAIILTGTVCLFGCSSMPSGEARNREAIQQYEADKKSEEFASSLPPAR